MKPARLDAGAHVRPAKIDRPAAAQGLGAAQDDKSFVGAGVDLHFNVGLEAFEPIFGTSIETFAG